MDFNLYLIEILVQEVFYDGAEVDKYNITVDCQLGPIADINIQFEEKTQVHNMKLANPGKSFLFPAATYVLKHQIAESEIKFTVRCATNRDTILGEATMQWPRSFRKLVERSESDKNLLPASCTEKLNFNQLDSHTGHIQVFMRFSSLGNDIQTPYQVVQTKDEAMSYLFKGTNIPTAFRSPDYGRGGSNDLLAVGPLFSHKDRGRKPSNYSLDITVSEIEANLCNEEDCIAAYKFKKLGIGPLAHPKPEFISPCGGPTCQYGYLSGSPPCVGHRKCKFSTPVPMPKELDSTKCNQPATCGRANQFSSVASQAAPNVCGSSPSSPPCPTRTFAPIKCQQQPVECPSIACPPQPDCGNSANTSNAQRSSAQFTDCFANAPINYEDGLKPLRNKFSTKTCPFPDCPIEENLSKPFKCAPSWSSQRHLRGGSGEPKPYQMEIQTDHKLHNTPINWDQKKTTGGKVRSCCGKPNCRNAKKCRNPNCKQHGHRVSNSTNLPNISTHCEDCGGYSVSGRTCKDLRREGGTGFSFTHNIDDLLDIENSHCFCNPNCARKIDEGSQTGLCQTDIISRKSIVTSLQPTHVMGQNESHSESNADQCDENTADETFALTPGYYDRLSGGGGGNDNDTGSAKKGISPVSGKRLQPEKAGRGSGDDTESLSPRKRHCHLVYNIGDTYPRNRIGHKMCGGKISSVPATKGWDWFPEPAIPPLKPRREYRPGFISKEVQQIINEARLATGLTVAPVKAPKKKKRRFKTGGVSSVADDEDEGDDEYEVEDKQTLIFRKAMGVYYFKCNPLRDPKTVGDNEDPYFDCPPIELKYTRDPLRAAMKNVDTCDCCTCGDDDVSDEDDELNLDFSPPMGVIEMERMKKYPNVVHFWTQYDPSDFGCPPLKSASASKKGGKKAKDDPCIKK